MADMKSVDEGAELPEKRRPENPEEEELDPSKRQKIEPLPEKNGIAGKISSELDKNSSPEDEDVENEDDDDEDEDEDEIVDQKGKGVVIDLKGKGKMVDEDDEDDEDDDEDGSSDDSSDSDLSGDEVDGSDWEDDPLLEVDLNNILPSRTRKGGGRVNSGVRFFGNDHSTGKDV
ncbi:F13K23.8 protein [Striga asiatica]|uniref:F13K23.8 protein n=1 Tax=Striga asiatica TaxID=4170 RepID=A0A5A7PHJ3_STRAF|nr:F13K23.8 protein [Striga asiatica]